KTVFLTILLLLYFFSFFHFITEMLIIVFCVLFYGNRMVWVFCILVQGFFVYCRYRVIRKTFFPLNYNHLSKYLDLNSSLRNEMRTIDVSED
ncbi:hypothetical protein M153_71730001, partial [Pseudoloma neurophilia]